MAWVKERKERKGIEKKIAVQHPSQTLETKVLDKILVNQIQQCIKRILHLGQVVFIPGMQDWLNIKISM